jgi:hypothetical protein
VTELLPSFSDVLVFAYLCALVVLLAVYLVYLHAASFRIKNSERDRLAEAELRLAHISSLVDAPDVRMMLESPESRRYLVREFSTSLKKDVMELVKAKRLPPAGLFLASLFLFGYCVLWIKGRVYSSVKDLRFLIWLELSVFRAAASVSRAPGTLGPGSA